MKAGKSLVVMMCGMLMAGAALAQDQSKGASLATASISLSTTTLGPLGMTTVLYCESKTNFDSGDTAREVFRRFTKCLVGMIPNWGEGTTEGVKWTGRNLESIPQATQGTSDGTTDGLSGKEQRALIEAVQEDLMGVVAGHDAGALSEKFMEIKRTELAIRGEAAPVSEQQLAAEVIRDLEAVRVSL